MAHLLDDCRMILATAEKQFDALQREITEFFESGAAELVIETDDKTGEKVLHLKQDVTLPPEWGFELGQMMNTARTALDHLIYALAVKGGGNRERDKTAFPIFEDRDQYWAVRGRGARKTTVRDTYLAGVPERWRERVDAVQPYRHKNPDRVITDPLAVLADVANTHKHKLLKAARITIATPTHRCFVTSPSTVRALEVRFKPGTDEISVQANVQGMESLTPPGVVINPKTQPDGKFGLGVIFGEPPRPVDPFRVKDAIRWSGSVVKWFEPAFDPGV